MHSPSHHVDMQRLRARNPIAWRLTHALVERLAQVLIIASLGCVGVLAADRKPNVVLIFIDDMGYADIGPFGNTQVKTPNLDQFAAQGMKFTSFYATPVCSMSRACLMTGCYNTRVSIPGVLFPNSSVGLHPNEITLAEVAKQQGYATCCIGKWHLGHQSEFLPIRQGFDSYFGIPYSNDMGAKPNRPDFPPLPLMRDDKVIETEPDQSQLTRRYTEEALRFIETNKSQPFFLYMPHTMIHFPLAASEAFKGKSKMGFIGDTIEEIDWSVGQVMQKIKDCQLDQDTLVIFTSDNGPARRDAPPLRGNKGTSFEGGVREPCMMRWVGKIPAGTTCNQIAGNIDVLPTLANIVGAELPKDLVLDGRDITRLMMDPRSAAVRDTHLYFAGDGKLAAIRQGNWKLFLKTPAAIRRAAKQKADEENKKSAPSEEGQLYDLSKDIGESQNVAAMHPDVVSSLEKLAADRLAEIEANKRPAGKAR